MSYTDFYIGFEHKFLRNIYSKEELATSTYLSALENYYKIFDKFLTTVILLETVRNSHLTFDEIVSNDLAEFFLKKYADSKNFKDFTKVINRTEVKHTKKTKKCQNLPKNFMLLFMLV